MDLLTQAFKESDIDKLHAAIAQGADINQHDEYDDPLWGSALFAYTNWERI